jgi:hypothetical protein
MNSTLNIPAMRQRISEIDTLLRELPADRAEALAPRLIPSGKRESFLQRIRAALGKVETQLAAAFTRDAADARVANLGGGNAS